MRFKLYILCERRKAELGSVMQAQSKLWCVSEARGLPASASRPSLLGPGHFPSWVIWQWALIFSTCCGRKGGKATSWLPLTHCVLLAASAPMGRHPLLRFWTLHPRATALHGSLWAPPSPWQKQDVMFLSAASSSCLSALVSKADRNILRDLPSLACLKTMTLFPFRGEVAAEF